MKNKNLILTLMLLLGANKSYSQWVTKIVDNKLDAPYKISYCTDALDKSFLKLEVVGEQLSFYLGGSYFCDDMITVDIALVVNGEPKRYTIEGMKGSNSKVLFLVDDLLAVEQAEFFKDFKACSSAVVRINESHCTSDIFKFNMSGSTKAVNFMLN
ncbi:hypothetical protein EBT25_10355 [bacterium]|jgi:hypothetical protein|nr:hypothetical protein [bacterium]